MDQRHSKMSIMAFYVIAGPPNSFLPLQPRLGFSDSQMLDPEKRVQGGASLSHLEKNLREALHEVRSVEIKIHLFNVVMIYLKSSTGLDEYLCQSVELLPTSAELGLLCLSV